MSVSKKPHIGLVRVLTMFGSNSGPLEHPTLKSVYFCVLNLGEGFNNIYKQRKLFSSVQAQEK